MGRWKAEMGRIREEKRRRKKIKEKKMRRKKIQVREKIIKIRKIIVPRIYGYGKSKNKCTKMTDMEPSGYIKYIKFYVVMIRFFSKSKYNLNIIKKYIL